ncbi:DUF300-domain-containing protein [Pluteus cervinus]|uniref:DUF300-domain-containing protein n=1 Tax=Pluteus cervinus TaxID=181527 RepID=A0ACD3B3M8_9AGAR|nr:DUF300-domain-containing protein [Pluteus cervinus]
MSQCPSDNNQAIDQSGFWDSGMDLDAHRIGWAIAGGCALVTVIITTLSVLQHCRNYTNPREQRQILRILYMPPVYAIISFFSYRFFRDYTYYSFISVAYEAITLSAFLMLIIEYVADTTHGHDPKKALERKDKQPLPFPFCCWRYRPTKGYFLYTIKWTVLQYVFVRVGASIAGIICEKLGILCDSESFNPNFAAVYIECADFISISIALYGLLWFYNLMKSELATKKPLAKFLCIKLIVMFTFYQGFIFEALEGRVIHATLYWSATNIANGLNALAVCIEMVIFSALMMWAYSANEYKKEGAEPTSIGRPLLDSINFSDFWQESIGALRYYFGEAKKKKAQRLPSREPSAVDGFPLTEPIRSTSADQLMGSNAV